MSDETPIPKPPMKLADFKLELGRLAVLRDEAEKAFNRAADQYAQFLFDNLGIAPGGQATVESTITFVERLTAMQTEEAKCS